MDEKLLRVLVIEDSENDYKLLLRALSKESILVDARRVDTAESLQLAMRERKWDVVISDNDIPDRRISVQSSMELSKQVNPNTPFIIVSGTIGEENAVKLMKLGVNDYILKDNMARLAPAIKREVADAASRMEKVSAEKKLTESEERYRMLAESIKDMFFALNKELICTFWNNAAQRMMNLTAAEAMGKHIFELLPQIKNSEVKEKFFESINTQESSTIEIEYTFDHIPRYYQVTIYPSAEMHSIIVKDISESKNITRRLEIVNEELETFIYRVSHDIRGPLASVQGLLNLAKNEPFPPLAEDFFSRIGKMINRLDEVIKGLQDVVKIKQERVVHKQTTMAAMLERAKPKGVHDSFAITLECDQNCQDGLLITDEDLLVLTLEKLIDNAIVFCLPSRKPNIVIKFSRKETDYQIMVADNGMGIADDMHDKIFKMFFRGNLESKGSGLGLYLAASAIGKLGGTIRIKSEAGQGSVFTIRLPIHSKQKHFQKTYPINSYKVG